MPNEIKLLEIKEVTYSDMGISFVCSEQPPLNEVCAKINEIIICLNKILPKKELVAIKCTECGAIAEMEKGCWYSMTTKRGALFIIKFSELSPGGSVVCKKAFEISLLEGCVMIHDNLYILPGFINLDSIKKLA